MRIYVYVSLFIEEAHLIVEDLNNRTRNEGSGFHTSIHTCLYHLHVLTMSKNFSVT